ncbi:MAG TPA: outer membrane protein assembly factor BamA, partial [Elusimicrobia bacterium]|nr:outer membrane protein assembly factor BamA [Elusimicrobiota bacterium]
GEAAPAAEPAVEFTGPWEIGEVAVRGTVNVKPKVITRTAKARKGRLYYRDFVTRDVEAILGLGSVDKVSVDIEEIPGKPSSEKLRPFVPAPLQARVTYVVTEKPMIKKVLVEGAKQLSKSSVKDEMSLRERDFFDELKVREDLIKIADKYRDKGFLDVSADYEVVHDTAALTCVLTVKVEEGSKVRVSSVNLEGVEGFKTKKLVKRFKNRPKKIYQPAELANDLRALEDHYRNRGYSDFGIIESSAVFNADRSSVAISVSVREGAKTKFGETTFSGNSVYASSELAGALAYRRGKLYNNDRFEDTVRAIQEKYADKGYLRAQVRPLKVPNGATGELDIEFAVAENSPIFVGHIDVEGNKATKTHVLRREVAQKEGEVFSAAKVRRSQEKIFNLGFIDDVNPVINPTADPDTVDLVFDVAEGKPGMLTAGAGISSREGVVGTLSVSHMNMFGLAHRMSLAWNFGKRVQDYNLSWTMPWIGDSPTSLGLNLFNTRRYRPYQTSLSAYTERRTGGKVTLAPRFDDDKYTLTTSYTYERVQIMDVDEIYRGELQSGTSVTSSVFVEFARDTRDSVWDPTRGGRGAIGLEFTGGPLLGDVDFYKPSVSYSHNFKLFSIDDYPFVLSIANRAGYIARFGDTERVPFYEKYFLGGSETIRGYNSNGQVGPLEGGRLYDVLNLEFKFPLARERRRTIVQWAFFFDVGNSWDRFDDVSLRTGDGEKQLKMGAGFGIRFTTPAFPIRLDWGYGFNHKDGEQRSDIYFTLGNLF